MFHPNCFVSIDPVKNTLHRNQDTTMIFHILRCLKTKTKTKYDMNYKFLLLECSGFYHPLLADCFIFLDLVNIKKKLVLLVYLYKCLFFLWLIFLLLLRLSKDVQTTS